MYHQLIDLFIDYYSTSSEQYFSDMFRLVINFNGMVFIEICTKLYSHDLYDPRVVTSFGHMHLTDGP